MSAAASNRIESRAQLVDALAVASELEQGLSLQYLFAAFSLKKDLDEGLGDGDELITVRRWAASIFFIAAQEMLHLAQAANLLIAIGGAPHLARPNFPQPSGTYPPDLGWELTAFSLAALDRFIAYESPDEPPIVGDDNDPIVPSRLTHASIGEMYAAIGEAFENLELADHDLFIGSPADQISGALTGFPQLVEVTDRATAKRAVALIVDQGEGTRKDHIDSHYGMFTTIRNELQQLLQQRPDFEPARPVADNPMAELHTDTGPSGPGQLVNLIADPTTRAVQDVFTSSYDLLLLSLFRFFAGGRHDSMAPAMKQVTLRLMMTVVRPLGELLTRLPMGDPYPGLTAGPSFEIFPEIELLPHAYTARVLIAERLQETAVAARALAQGSDLEEGAATVMSSVAASLDELSRLLDP